jgi:hypothetical protein
LAAAEARATAREDREKHEADQDAFPAEHAEQAENVHAAAAAQAESAATAEPFAATILDVRARIRSVPTHS